VADPAFELLLLGVLKHQSRHGYSLLEFIERDAGGLVGLSRATAYQVLRRLERRGWAAAVTEQVGKRPPRRVYSITPAGEARLAELLRSGLAEGASPRAQADVALMFMDELPRAERLAALRRRLQRAEAEAARLAAAPSHGAGSSVDHAIARLRAHAEAEVGWLRQLVVALSRPEEPKGA
jgi:DNA-binding PadR family transcriptional regulator